MKLASAPRPDAYSRTSPNRSRSRRTTSRSWSESFFTQPRAEEPLSASTWRAPPIVACPRTRRSCNLVAAGLGCAAWSGSAVSALRATSRGRLLSPPAARARGQARRLTGWLMARLQSSLTHLIAGKVHALHGQPSAACENRRPRLAYDRVNAAWPWSRQSGPCLFFMLANETSLKRSSVMALMAALLQALIAIALVGAAGQFVFTA